MTAAQTNNTTADQPSLGQIDWIIEILRGHHTEISVTPGVLPEGHVEVDRYTVYPSLRQPRLLVSGGSNRVRAAVLERMANRSRSWSSMAKRVSAQAARIGADQVALGPDLIVSRPKHLADSDDIVTLREHLEAHIGADHLCLGLTVGPLRPNRKPVIQLMDHSGRLVAYAKVGWDPSTADMVDHEGKVLSRLPRVANLVTPKVLHHDTWRSMSLLVTAPIDHSGPARPTDAQVVDALGEITRITPRSVVSLADAAWTRRQRSRIAALGDAGEDLETLLDRCIELRGDTVLDSGEVKQLVEASNNGSLHKSRSEHSVFGQEADFRSRTILGNRRQEGFQGRLPSVSFFGTIPRTSRKGLPP